LLGSGWQACWVDVWGAAVLLVPGDPGAVGQLSGRLLTLAGGLADAAQRVGLVQGNGWSGAAAATFVQVRGVHAGAFVGAAEAFGSAGAACGAYARVLAEAQGRAGLAVRLHAEAEAATCRWEAVRQVARSQGKEAGQAHVAVVGTPAVAVLQRPDPGGADRVRAEQIVASARADVRAAAARAAGQVDRAAGMAPTQRTVGSWLGSWFTGPGGLQGGLGEGATRAVEVLAVGAWDTSLVGAAWGYADGERPDPRQALRTAKVWSGPPKSQNAAQRRAAVGQLVDADDWADHPARAAGYTATNLTLLLAGDGLGDTAEATCAATRAFKTEQDLERSGRLATSAADGSGTGAGGSLVVRGANFSESEFEVAQFLSDKGHHVVLQEADSSASKMSDMVVDGRRWDTYTPRTDSVKAVVSAVARKAKQVEGGVVVVDLRFSGLSIQDCASVASRVQGVTGGVSDVIVLKF